MDPAWILNVYTNIIFSSLQVKVGKYVLKKTKSSP